MGSHKCITHLCSKRVFQNAYRAKTLYNPNKGFDYAGSYKLSSKHKHMANSACQDGFCFTVFSRWRGCANDEAREIILVSGPSMFMLQNDLRME